MTIQLRNTAEIDSQSADTDATTAVVRAIATELDVDELDLPPLYDAIDADALNDFVGSVSDRSDAFVTFEYVDREVTVHANGRVQIGSTPELMG